jgi:hypothetical protein
MVRKLLSILASDYSSVFDDYVSFASFLFDDTCVCHPNIILPPSCLLLFKPSQLKIVLKIAVKQRSPAAVAQIGSSAVRIIPYMTNARKNIMAVLLSVMLLRTLTLTLSEPLWTKPKGWVTLSSDVWICEVREEMRIVVLSTQEVV